MPSSTLHTYIMSKSKYESLPDICIVYKTPTNEVSTFVNLFDFDFYFTLENHLFDKGHCFVTPRFGLSDNTSGHRATGAGTADSGQKEGYDASFSEKLKDH